MASISSEAWFLPCLWPDFLLHYYKRFRSQIHLWNPRRVQGSHSLSLSEQYSETMKCHIQTGVRLSAFAPNLTELFSYQPSRFTRTNMVPLHRDGRCVLKSRQNLLCFFRFFAPNPEKKHSTRSWTRSSVQTQPNSLCKVKGTATASPCLGAHVLEGSCLPV